MRDGTRLDHERRIEEAVKYLTEHLDDPIGPAELADRVCLSRFHFHRVFLALLGETVGDLHRRLRLERAAYRLRTTEQPIIEIAFDAGYATHEAFIRAFRSAFGRTPSSFRKHLNYLGEMPTPNEVHFNESGKFRLKFPAPQGVNMNVEIKEIAPRKAVCISHKGPYFMIGDTFNRLFGWIGKSGQNVQEGVAIFYDDPNVTAPESLRSEAGAFVAADVKIDDPEVHVVEIPGGKYAVYTHMGHYQGLGEAWNSFAGKWFAASGYEYGPGPAFEMYMTDCSKVPVEELRTDLYISLKEAPAAVS